MRRTSIASCGAAALFATVLGCASGPTSPLRAPAGKGHGYALLYEILGQERQVAMLLLVKIERDELEVVIDDIARTCDAAYGKLEEFTPGIELTDTGLPVEERRTRELIAATRQEQLLAATGLELELQLLLTQNEALTYAAHLADAISRTEADPVRLAFVRTLWKDLTLLREDVMALLRRPVHPED